MSRRSALARSRALATIAVAAMGLAPLPAATSAAEALLIPPPISIQTVHLYAQPFLLAQSASDGSYPVSPRVQAHEKAEIGMALAAEATQTPSYAESAYQDLQWLLSERYESNGGLNWEGPSSTQFFECHQHWFLIASEMLRRQLGLSGGLESTQLTVWRFLTTTNPGRADFYLDNHDRYGPFFAYRSVDRSGDYQTQAAFKGSYEMGAALWSLSLMQEMPWMEGQPPPSGLTNAEYLFYTVIQAMQPPQDRGWYDPAEGRWVRSLLWTSPGWSGWEAPDWKYGLSMQEGALQYKILAGGSELDSQIRSETEQLLARVEPAGTINGLPDQYGTPALEYGEALSVLGLSAIAFIEGDPLLATNCLYGGQRVASYVSRSLAPEVSEDGAVLLRGLAQMYKAQTAVSGAVAGMEQLGAGATGEGAAPALRIWPNPMVDRTTVSFTLPAGSRGLVWIGDVTGRRILSRPIVRGLAHGADGKTFSWGGRDERGRLMPNGIYRVVVETALGRRTGSVVVLR